MQIDPEKAIGLWGYEAWVPAHGLKCIHPTSTHNSIYADDCLTIRITDVSGMRDPDADDFYKLDTRWEGSQLFYCAPGGRWQAFAFFSDDVFKMEGAARVYTFKRIKPGEVPDWNKGIPREDREEYQYPD